ncbi:iron uptake transporter deferrochelatase/peroxidase subunit [Actinoplanes sp. N902-109]|uniref:iron uptake transporter deferrochelatase/peroxidase subunit n=1 Tax=Actinoplanes sp. (strain N902-109) TaxID=649831 RepID=UPI00032946AF|nr:iron uptake transporter deferrochelatase/peroxidase subunit [Actinoplanes sp. N902-109]AGL16986.1 Dyp-type peroxidase family [Actinoplanes sp. N902-109]
MRASRRGFLALGGAAVAGAGAGALVTHAAEAGGSNTTPPADRVPFHGARQAGIATPAQQRLAFAAYDVTAGDRASLQALLQTWTAAAAAMCAGEPVPGDSTTPQAPPADTGEAIGLSPANLTITVGFGPSLFDGRFGLADRRPAALADLPRFAGDHLDPLTSGGDLCIQACADDPMVAFHAIRNLARLGRGSVVMRWSQLGFGKATSTSAKEQTPRNLFGFKDGTRNIETSDDAAMNQHVWVGADGDQRWMTGGTYLVARKIRMKIEAWDRDYLADQENVVGRQKVSGAPLGGSAEHDTPDFGGSLIPADAHIRLASPEGNNGVRILRRGYSYTDGMFSSSGELDAGLFFIAFQRDPRTQFVALQRKLAAHDALNEYVQHVGSGLYACPPGVPAAGDYWGSQLFTS